ncbi:MAG: response regulator transcription factor [Pseudomonadota bacterium]
MERPVILWVDFTRKDEGSPALMMPGVEDCCEFYRVSRAEDISGCIRSIGPDILCFDYAYPEPTELVLLSQTKHDFPRIPILMLTEHHSETLAIWALRARVWDYLVKPLSKEELLRPVKALSILRDRQRSDAPRQVIRREIHAPVSAHLSRTSPESVIFKAQMYIDSHFADKVSANEVAKICNMSGSHFSRVFKQVCGITFSDYLLKTRIKKAVELLRDPHTPVTSVCYDVGFYDPSYFSRVFRRYAGLTPSEYQQRCLKEGKDNSMLSAELHLDERELKSA